MHQNEKQQKVNRTFQRQSTRLSAGLFLVLTFFALHCIQEPKEKVTDEHQDQYQNNVNLSESQRLQEKSEQLSKEQADLDTMRRSLTRQKVKLRSELLRMKTNNRQLDSKQRGLREKERKLEADLENLDYRERRLDRYQKRLRNKRKELLKLKYSLEATKKEIAEIKANKTKQNEEPQKCLEQLEKEKEELEKKRLELQKWEEDLKRREALLLERDKKEPLVAYVFTRNGMRVEAYDTTKDGKHDTWLTYDSRGKLYSEEYLTKPVIGSKKSGKVIVTYSSSKDHCPTQVKGDMNGDGVNDFTAFYENCYEKRREVDSNFDGKIDQWIDFKVSGSKVCLDRVEKDLTFNGFINYIETYRNCEPLRQEWDMNENGHKEVVKSLIPGQVWSRRIGFDAKLKADVHLRKQENKKAEEWYLRAIQEFKMEWLNEDSKINQEVAECYLSLGSIYHKRRPTSARSYYDSVFAYGNYQQRQTAGRKTADTYFQSKDYKNALDNYQKVLQKDNADMKSLHSYTEIILLEKNKSRKKEAFSFLRNIANRLAMSGNIGNKVKANSLWLVSSVYIKENSFSFASGYLKRALNLDKSQYKIYVDYAFVSFALGKDNEAVSAINRAFKLNKTDFEVLWNASLINYIAKKREHSTEYTKDLLKKYNKKVREIYLSKLAELEKSIPNRRLQINEYRYYLRNQLAAS